MLVKIMSDFGLREIFKQDFEQLHLKFFQLDRMIEVSAHSEILSIQLGPLWELVILSFAIHIFEVVESMLCMTNYENESVQTSCCVIYKACTFII